MMLDQLLTGRNLALAGGVFVLMSLVKNLVLPKFWLGNIGQRLLPVLPIVLGVSGAFAGLCDCNGWQDKLLIGLIAGWASSHTFKLGKTSILGYGIDGGSEETPSDPATPAPATPAPTPATPVAPAAPTTPATPDKKG